MKNGLAPRSVKSVMTLIQTMSAAAEIAPTRSWRTCSPRTSTKSTTL
jgi:hypothetical protein